MVKQMAMVGAVLPTAVGLADGASVAIDATQPGAVLPNSSQVLTFWNGVMKGDRSPVAWPKELRRDYPIGFARYAELMACTGGNKSRDLFKNPGDRKPCGAGQGGSQGCRDGSGRGTHHHRDAGTREEGPCVACRRREL